MKTSQHKNTITSKEFHRITKYLWNTNKYTKTDVILYARINSLSSKYGYCYTTNKWLSIDSDTSEKNIRRSIAKLEQDGFIRRQMSKNGTVRKIYLSTEVLKTIPNAFKTNPCMEDVVEPVAEQPESGEYFINDVIKENFAPINRTKQEEVVEAITEDSLKELYNEI